MKGLFSIFLLALTFAVVAAEQRPNVIFMKRSVLLLIVGVFCCGGVSRAWPDVLVSGVLPRIALCYLVAASLYVMLPRKGIVIAAVVCLQGYWVAMTFVPFPDVDLSHCTIGEKRLQANMKSPAKTLAGLALPVLLVRCPYQKKSFIPL